MSWEVKFRAFCSFVIGRCALFHVVTGKGSGDMRGGVANKRANMWTYERARIYRNQLS